MSLKFSYFKACTNCSKYKIRSSSGACSNLVIAYLKQIYNNYTVSSMAVKPCQMINTREETLKIIFYSKSNTFLTLFIDGGYLTTSKL